MRFKSILIQWDLYNKLFNHVNNVKMCNRLKYTLILMIFFISFTGCSINKVSNIENVESEESYTSESSESDIDVSDDVSDTSSTSESPVKIYLYGEKHGVEEIMDKELELWCDYYNNENMRHLFVELPYFTAEFLNLWMQTDNDEILNEIYNDWEDTLNYNPYIKEFYKNIKSKCPETIFHGTDVGHQFYNTGERYLKYLEENNMKDTEKYKLTQEAIEQGKHYNISGDEVYRENKMVENFIREYSLLNNESIMGIYGAYHTGLYDMDYATQTVPCMANQLKNIFKNMIYSEDLSVLAMKNKY